VVRVPVGSDQRLKIDTVAHLIIVNHLWARADLYGHMIQYNVTGGVSCLATEWYFGFITYVFNPTTVIQAFFRACD